MLVTSKNRAIVTPLESASFLVGLGAPIVTMGWHGMYTVGLVFGGLLVLGGVFLLFVGTHVATNDGRRAWRPCVVWILPPKRHRFAHYRVQLPEHPLTMDCFTASGALRAARRIERALDVEVSEMHVQSRASALHASPHPLRSASVVLVVTAVTTLLILVSAAIIAATQ